MSAREKYYLWLLGVATIWVLVSALAVTVCVKLEGKGLAWVWLASFVLSAVAAAYGFGRLL